MGGCFFILDLRAFMKDEPQQEEQETMTPPGSRCQSALTRGRNGGTWNHSGAAQEHSYT